MLPPSMLMSRHARADARRSSGRCARLMNVVSPGITAERTAPRSCFEEQPRIRNQPRHGHASGIKSILGSCRRREAPDDERPIFSGWWSAPAAQAGTPGSQNAARDLADFRRRMPGSAGEAATKPSWRLTPCSPNEMRRSRGARAHGSTMAWKETSDSCFASRERRSDSIGFLPGPRRGSRR